MGCDSSDVSTFRTCPKCGGQHWGSPANHCPIKDPPLPIKPWPKDIIERTYTQSAFDRELALRVGIALEAAENIISSFASSGFTVTYAKLIKEIRAIPSDASLVEQHDAEICQPSPCGVEGHLRLHLKHVKVGISTCSLCDKQEQLFALHLLEMMQMDEKWQKKFTLLLAQREKAAVARAWNEALANLAAHGSRMSEAAHKHAMRERGIAITDTAASSEKPVAPETR